MYMAVDEYSLQQAQTVVLSVLCLALFLADGNNRQLVKFLAGAALFAGLLLYHLYCKLQQRVVAMEYYRPMLPEAGSAPPPAARPPAAADTAADDDTEMLQEHYSPETKGADSAMQRGIFSQQRMRSKAAFGRHSHSELINRKKARHASLLHEQWAA